MKTYKLVIIHFLFFVLTFLATHLLKEQLFIKRACYLFLISGLTCVMFFYFYRTKQIFKGFVINLASLFVLFELMKAIECLFKLMPKCSETIIISMIASIIGIIVYLGFIIIICRFVKILQRKLLVDKTL